MALSDAEKVMIQDAMGIALREAGALLRRGMAMDDATLRGRAVMRAMLDGYGAFAPADVNKMVDSFKMVDNGCPAPTPEGDSR